MKVLFITRKYPPQVGGMENYSYNLIKHYPDSKKVIALGKSQKHLVWFLPYALVRGLFLARSADLVYLTDGLLAPIGLLIKLITRRQVMITVHGLDLTFKNWLYQKFNVGAIGRLDKIVAVSQATHSLCLKKGFNKEKCVMIPNGVDTEEFRIEGDKPSLIKQLENQYNIRVQNKTILVTVGRFVERKGIKWFINKVMPELVEEIVYLIVGDGPERRSIKKAIKENKLADRVFLLGQVDNQMIKRVFNLSDIFIMPNIRIQSDREGFGLVAIEASACGLPVVASYLEGITDAVHDNQNGYLVEPENAAMFKKEIRRILDKENYLDFRKEVADYTKENFSWTGITSKYIYEMKNTLA